MTRKAKAAWLVFALVAAIALIWVAGGFLWPRPQFDRPGTPWPTDTSGSSRSY